MLNNRKAQGLSITTIIVAVIGLIIVIVLIAIFTGRIGGFSVGLDESKTCKSVCDGISKKYEPGANIAACAAKDDERIISGSFFDVAEGNTCCCYGKK